MRKLLNFTDWLLLGTSGFMDFIQEIRDPFDLVKNYYKNFYGYIPSRLQKRNFYRLYWNQLKTGNIQKTVRNGEVFLELTSTGQEKLRRKFPFAKFQKQIWDDKWRLVIFDIEEESRWIRDSFRRKLKELGFGQLQKSVWITPYDFLGDLKEFVTNHKLTRRVILIETENFFVDDIKTLAAELWPLSELNKYYKTICKEILILRKIKNTAEKKKMLIQIRQKTLSTIFNDPHLPHEMLPVNWWGNKFKVLLKKQKIFEAK